MRQALRMEWTKLRTIRATGWSMLAMVASTVAVSAFTAAQTGPTDCAPRPCTLDTVRIALTGVTIGPELTSDSSTSGTWLVEVPRTCRTASMMSSRPCM